MSSEKPEGDKSTDQRARSASAGTGTPGSGPSDDARPVGLEQIREILFGSSYREFERRLALAETHLAARAHELEQEARRRIEVLEMHLQKETEALSVHLERQRVETSDGLRNMIREF